MKPYFAQLAELKSKWGHYVALLLVLSLILCLTATCSPGKVDVQKPGTRARTIAVVPFEVEEMVRSGSNGEPYLSCSICGSTFRAGHVEPEAQSALTGMLFDALKNVPGIIPITPGRFREELRTKEMPESLKGTSVEFLQKIGKASNAEAVLSGRVFRYEERQGHSYAAEKPASIAFDLHLVRTSDGAIIWKSRFDETQTSLFDNILNISTVLKRHFKWITAKELAGEGVGRAVQEFGK